MCNLTCWFVTCCPGTKGSSLANREPDSPAHAATNGGGLGPAPPVVHRPSALSPHRLEDFSSRHAHIIALLEAVSTTAAVIIALTVSYAAIHANKPRLM